ncbi:MAG: hypothetical protein M3Z75_22235 [Actinomycetota bacterium]|nr:hypothetical protein [Actinomycetota bacterium]
MRTVNNLLHHARNGRTRVRRAALIILAAAALLAAAPATAFAVTAPQPATQAAPTVKIPHPGFNVYCTFDPVEPFFLIAGSNKMYAQGKITGCSNPAPSSCKMTVDLLTTNTIVGVLKSTVTNWQTCKTFTVNTPAFTCNTTPEKYGFYTQVTLQGEYNGQYDSTTADSPMPRG